MEKKKEIAEALEEAKEREAQRLKDERVLRNGDLTEALVEAGVIDANKAIDVDVVLDENSIDGDFKVHTGGSGNKSQNRSDKLGNDF